MITFDKGAECLLTIFLTAQNDNVLDYGVDDQNNNHPYRFFITCLYFVILPVAFSIVDDALHDSIFTAHVPFISFIVVSRSSTLSLLSLCFD